MLLVDDDPTAIQSMARVLSGQASPTSDHATVSVGLAQHDAQAPVTGEHGPDRGFASTLPGGGSSRDLVAAADPARYAVTSAWHAQPWRLAMDSANDPAATRAVVPAARPSHAERAAA